MPNIYVARRAQSFTERWIVVAVSLLFSLASLSAHA
jgi:hypothetical protein